MIELETVHGIASSLPSFVSIQQYPLYIAMHLPGPLSLVSRLTWKGAFC